MLSSAISYSVLALSNSSFAISGISEFRTYEAERVEFYLI